MMITIGSAIYINPPITIPVKMTGNNIIVNNFFVIPHAVFIPNMKSFPNTPNRHIPNNSSNISFFSFSYAVIPSSVKLNKSPKVVPNVVGVIASMT